MDEGAFVACSYLEFEFWSVELEEIKKSKEVVDIDVCIQKNPPRLRLTRAKESSSETSNCQQQQHGSCCSSCSGSPPQQHLCFLGPPNRNSQPIKYICAPIKTRVCARTVPTVNRQNEIDPLFLSLFCCQERGKEEENRGAAVVVWRRSERLSFLKVLGRGSGGLGNGTWDGGGGGGRSGFCRV